jgi:nitric oxide reductase large subunit
METQGNVALQNTVDEQSAPLTLGNYIVMMIVSAIPVVGFIMLLVWSFSGNTNINKKNWARAQLIVMIIVAVVGAIVGASVVSALVSAAAAMY